MVKKDLFKRFFIFIFLVFLCVDLSAKSKVKDLDEALDDAVVKLIAVAESGTQIKVAIGEIRTVRSNGSVCTALEEFIRDYVQDKIVNSGSIKVLERSQVDALAKERDYQQTGAVKDEDWAEIGAALGANYIIYGEGKWLASSYLIFLKIANVETQEIEKTARVEVSKQDKELKRMIGSADSPERQKKSKFTGDKIYLTANSSVYFGHSQCGDHGSDLIDDYESLTSANYSGDFKSYISLGGNILLNVKLFHGFGIETGIGLWNGGGELLIDREGDLFYAEKYKLMGLETPIALSFQFKLFRTSLKLIAGANIFMPLNCTLVYRGNGTGDKQEVTLDKKFIPGFIAGADYIIPLGKYIYIDVAYRYEKDFTPLTIEYDSQSYEILNRSGSYLNAGIGLKI